MIFYMEITKKRREIIMEKCTVQRKGAKDGKIYKMPNWDAGVDLKRRLEESTGRQYTVKSVK
jgi:hypothetical protein